MTKKTKTKTKTMKIDNTTVVCNDHDCPTHGSLKTRGRTFKGTVVSKNIKRIAIEFERLIYIRKYERYAQSKTKIHARLPNCISKDINIGDNVKIAECRPLSKIIHFVVIEKLKDAEDEQ